LRTSAVDAALARRTRVAGFSLRTVQTPDFAVPTPAGKGVERKNNRAAAAGVNSVVLEKEIKGELNERPLTKRCLIIHKKKVGGGRRRVHRTEISKRQLLRP